MALVAQPSFVAGEVDPALHHRIDLERFGSALATCRNWIVLLGGGVDRRQGFRHVNTAKGLARCVTFSFSSEAFQSYDLELGDEYMRVHTRGGTVLDGPAPFEVETPWAIEDVWALQFWQDGDVLYVTHPSYPIHEIRRLDHDQWEIVPFVTTRNTAAPTGLVILATGANGADSTTAKEWHWVVTAVGVADDADESLPSADLRPIDLQLSTLTPRTIRWDWAPNVAFWNVYRGRNAGVYGLVGSARPAAGQSSGTIDFNDDGQAPAMSDAPPSGRDPFNAPGKYPRAITGYQGRLAVAGSNDGPNVVDLSQPGSYHNFDVAPVPKDDDAIRVSVQSGKRDRIQALISLGRLIVNATSAEHSIAGAAGEGLTQQLERNKDSHFGADPVQPALAGSSGIFVRARGRGVLEVSSPLPDQAVEVRDLAVMAQHLFPAGTTVTQLAWCSQQSVLWAVRSDGVLLGLTYLREHEVWAWHRHDTPGGEFVSVAAVPEENGDALYAIIRRTILGSTVYHVERMGDDPGDPLHLDGALDYDGENASEITLTASIASGPAGHIYGWDTGEAARITASIPTFPFGGGPAAGPGIGATLEVRDPEDAESFQRWKIVEGVSSTEVVAVCDRPTPEALRGEASTSWGTRRATFTGLQHLAGLTVVARVDGELVVPTEPVAADGSITLPYDGIKVTVGLDYNSDLETPGLAARDTVRYRPLSIPKVYIPVQGTRGIFAGPDLDHLEEIGSRDVTESWGPVAAGTSVLEAGIKSNWRREGRIVVRANGPFPVRVLGLIPEVSAGG